MHPEILRELSAQRSHELRERAHRASLARTARRALRDWRRGHRAAGTDEFVVPAIPDYVDGSFRTAGDAAANAQDHVPATHRAA
jgi:hypothetical protein